MPIVYPLVTIPSLVMYAYSHRIKFFNAADSLDTINFKEALMMALQGISKKRDHHSDRGI